VTLIPTLHQLSIKNEICLDKSEKIEETYFPQLKKCEETFYRGKSEGEIKKLEEDGIYDAFLFIIKKCPVGEEEQVLFQEMMD
jgi:hypothetical protein